ncbi:MAG: GNAT family N-acetyltransferase [Methylocystis sp.]|nr:GNAT family N-acetyltransferase [Methylocystis sp.]
MLRRLYGISRPRRRVLSTEAASRYAWSWTSVGELAGEAGDWRALAEASLEPNPVYCPNFLIAAEKHLQGGRPIRVIVARDRQCGGALAALAPIQSNDWRAGPPGWITSLYCNPYTTLSHPLVRRDDAVAILTSVVHFLAQERRRDGLLFPWLTEGRAFFAALRDAAMQNGLDLVRVDGVTRPAIDPEPGNSGSRYAAAYCSKSRRQGVERRMRRLQEIGAVEFVETLLDEPGGREALEAFLELERKSWKGEAGTALACNEATRNFAYDAFGGADIVSRVRLRALNLDKRPIAMALDLESQGVAYAFKAAYDAEFARFSPGLLLDAQTASRIGAEFEIKRLDSFAQTDIAQSNVWRQEEPVGRYVMTLAPHVSGQPLARRVRFAGDVRRRLKQGVEKGRELVSGGARLLMEKRRLAALSIIFALPAIAALFWRAHG